MNNQESEFTKEQFIDTLSILQKEIKFFNEDVLPNHTSSRNISMNLDGSLHNCDDLINEVGFRHNF